MIRCHPSIPFGPVKGDIKEPLAGDGGSMRHIGRSPLTEPGKKLGESNRQEEHFREERSRLTRDILTYVWV